MTEGKFFTFSIRFIEPIKQSKIHQIIIEQNTIISTQVFKETANVLHRKFKFEWGDIALSKKRIKDQLASLVVS